MAKLKTTTISKAPIYFKLNLRCSQIVSIKMAGKYVDCIAFADIRISNFVGYKPVRIL